MIRTKFIHSLKLLCFFSMIVLVAGCGKLPNPDGRLDVSGKITLNGGPFEGAEMCSIRFAPCDDNPQNDANFTTFNSKTEFARNAGRRRLPCIPGSKRV